MTADTHGESAWVDGSLESGADGDASVENPPRTESGAPLGASVTEGVDSSFEPEEDAS